MKLEVISHEPEQPVRSAPPLLFIHGAWHAAWCWENFLPFFARHGYETHALSLRGHGGSDGHEGIRFHSAAHGYVADVAQVAESLDSPPVLIGHSMGGYVTQKYLETHSAPAAVLLASVPSAGIGRFALRAIRRHPWQFLKSQLTLNLSYLVETPALARDQLFSSSLSDEDLDRHFRRLQNESVRMQLEALFLKLPKPRRVKTPMLVVAAQEDRIFDVKEQLATARAYDAESAIIPGIAHDLMLDTNWEMVTGRILGWLARQFADTRYERIASG